MINMTDVVGMLRLIVMNMDCWSSDRLGSGNLHDSRLVRERYFTTLGCPPTGNLETTPI